MFGIKVETPYSVNYYGKQGNPLVDSKNTIAKEEENFKKAYWYTHSDLIEKNGYKSRETAIRIVSTKEHKDMWRRKFGKNTRISVVEINEGMEAWFDRDKYLSSLNNLEDEKEKRGLL